MFCLSQYFLDVGPLICYQDSLGWRRPNKSRPIKYDEANTLNKKCVLKWGWKFHCKFLGGAVVHLLSWPLHLSPLLCLFLRLRYTLISFINMNPCKNIVFLRCCFCSIISTSDTHLEYRLLMSMLTFSPANIILRYSHYLLHHLFWLTTGVFFLK